MVRSITTIVSFLVLGISCLKAQQDPITISINFRVFGVGNDSFEGLYFFDGEVYKELNFHKVSRSVNIYSYRGPKVFRLFLKNEHYQPADPTSKEYLSVASSTVDSSIEEALLVIHAHPANRSFSPDERQYQLYFINDDRAYFSRNSILLVNATGRALIGRIGATDVLVNVGISEPIPYSGKSARKTTRLAFALQTEKGTRLVMSNDVQLSSNRRIVLILMPPREQGSMRITMRKLSQSIYEDEEIEE